MKKKLLLFVLLFAGLTNAWAADNGSLAIDNIRNVVPGYSGSFDIVLSGASVTYCGYQFNLAMPAGLTYTGYSNGALLTNHTANVTDHTTYLTFIGESSSVDNFTAANGTLVTIYFTVASNASGTLTGGSLTTNKMSDNQAESYALADVNFSVPVGSTVTLSEDETSAPAPINDVNVKVVRELKGGVWNTLCLPFPMNAAQITSVFGSNAQIAELQSVTYDKEYNEDEDEDVVVGVKLTFGTVTEMEAHHPYIIKVSSPKSEFSVSSVVITTGTPSCNVGSSSNYKQFIGTYTTEAIIPDGGLYLMDNKFKYSSGSSKLKAFRAYFYLRDKLYGYKTASAPAITLDINGSTTGINALELDADKVADSYYNVQGLQVAQPTKGLYIVNGRKVIIK